MSKPEICQPKVSIITPTFNRLHFLRETCENIFKLNYNNWEWIIIDDGSTDGTNKFLVELHNGSNKVRFYKRSANHSKGPSGCRNQGIDLATGEFLVFVDDDDIVHPELLKVTTDILVENPEASFCRYNKQPFIGEWKPDLMLKKQGERDYSRFSRNHVSKMVTGQVPFACCTVIWNKKGLGNERFHEGLSYAEEWEFYNRLIIKNDFGLSLRRTLYYNRKHEHSNTGEFWDNDPVRRLSKIEATMLVVEELKSNNLIDSYMFKFFIQLGFFLDSEEIIKKILSSSGANFIVRTKYRMGFYLYPILRPIFRLKGEINNIGSSQGS